MTTHYARYRFNSKEQFESKRDAFNEEVTLEDGYTFIKKPDHFIVGRGYKPVTELITHEDGSITKHILTEDVTEVIEGVEYTHTVNLVTGEFLVDVIWADIESDEDGKGLHPYGWKTYSVKPKYFILKPLWGYEHSDEME